MLPNAGVMPSSLDTAKEGEADVPDIHAASVDELHEAFDLYDTKGAGKLGLAVKEYLATSRSGLDALL